jgi:hypothetical protein
MAFVKAVRICAKRFANAGYKRLAGPSDPLVTTGPDAPSAAPSEAAGLSAAADEDGAAGELLDSTARLQWKDVKIHFVTTETVEVTVGQRLPQNRTYRDLGFANKKSKPPKPKEAWAMLQTLARQRGLVPSGTEVAQKRIQEIRKALRKQFNIPDDPIPCQGGKYCPVFRISGDI